MRAWVLCEAFTLTGDAFNHETIHRSLAPWAGVYPTGAECMIALQRRVRERVRENYEGLKDAEAEIESDVADILRGVVHPDGQNNEHCRYNYSADDREVVWQTYPCEVKMPCEPDHGTEADGRHGMNMCTVAVSVRPEAEPGPRQLSASYLCCTGGRSVRNCAHYKALVVDGLKCDYECRWFRDGCRCRKAQKAARERAKRLLARWR